MTVEEIANSVLNLSERDAIDKIVAAGFSSRVRERNGKGLIGTCDYKLNRINLYIKNDIVYKTSIG